VIVRISTEGQYEIGDDDVDELNQLDNQAVAACDSSDEQAFHATYEKLLNFVRNRGRELGEDELEGSDVILPPPDVSLEDAREEFTGEGLIPG
jgi:hypothetical protein